MRTKAGEAAVARDTAAGAAGLRDGGVQVAPHVVHESPSRLGVLRHRHFRNVWTAAFISSVGGWMESIGIQWVMAEMTQNPEWAAAGYPGPALMMAYLGAALLGPMLLLGIAGGLLADRVNRRTLLLVTQGMLMVIAACLAAASMIGLVSPALLLGVSLANGVTMAFNVPAWQVLTPRLVPRAELTSAINLNGIQFNMARVVGPGLGGLIMHWYGATALFSINAASFLFILFAIWGTPDSPAPPPDAVSPWRRTREAFRYVFHNRGPFRVMIGLVLFSMLAGPLLRMLPLFITQVYHEEERAFGGLLAVMGLGAVIGGLSLRFFPAWYPKHHFIPLSLMFGGVALTGFAAATNIGVGGVLLFFCGVSWLWAFNSSMAALQLLVEDRMRGRVMAVANTFVFGAMPLGSLIAGAIGESVAGTSEDGFGIQVGVGSLALVLAVAGLVMLIWRTPEIDDIKPGDPGYERRPGLLRGVTAAAHRPQTSTPQPPMATGEDVLGPGV